MKKTRAELALAEIEQAMADLEAGKISRYKAMNIMLTEVSNYFDHVPIPYLPTRKARKVGGRRD